MFQTERLLLRAYCKHTDLPNVTSLLSDARVLPFVSFDYIAPQGTAFLAGLHDTIFDSPNAVCFVLQTLDTHEFVGFTNATFTLSSRKNREAEFGPIALDPRWWGRGFGREVTRWMVGYMFRTLEMHRLALVVVESNARAIRLYERIGFKVEGVEEKANWSHTGKWEDIIHMAIVDEEWAARQDAQAEVSYERVDVPPSTKSVTNTVRVDS